MLCEFRKLSTENERRIGLRSGHDWLRSLARYTARLSGKDRRGVDWIDARTELGWWWMLGMADRPLAPTTAQLKSPKETYQYFTLKHLLKSFNTIRKIINLLSQISMCVNLISSSLILSVTVAVIHQKVSSFPACLAHSSSMATLEEEEQNWESLSRGNWKGLGLTDPVKAVEVSHDG